MQALVVLAGILVVAVLIWQGERLHILPVPTRPGVRKAALKLMREYAPNAKNVIELGCGWGGMTRKLARIYPDVTGYERSYIPYIVSRLTTKTRRTDIFAADLGAADIVFCYLSPWHMERLAPKFANELKAGAVVVSAAFPIPGRAPLATANSVYLYRFSE